MVTTGANQAFTNLVLTLLDAGDTAMLFKPYYFNHMMALQMCGGGAPSREIIFGDTDDSLLPDLNKLEEMLRARAVGGKPVRLVVFTTPNNPTGMILPREKLERMSALCQTYGAWLCIDNTYEEFVHGKHSHETIEAPHVLNIFSFSKAYGMMG